MRAHGADLVDVVKVIVFVDPMDDYESMNVADAQFFPEAPPARTCVAVLALAGGARVEIEAWATRG